MKSLIPVAIALLALMFAISSVGAQTVVHNPALPNHLVFQWRIVCAEVHPSWSNDAFFAHRTGDQLVVYVGVYHSLEQALAQVPTAPEGTSAAAFSLIPFFHRKAISAADALALLQWQSSGDPADNQPAESVSYAVLVGHFQKIMTAAELGIHQSELSFVVNSDRSLSYCSGLFKSHEEASEHCEWLKAEGYAGAEPVRFVNGNAYAVRSDVFEAVALR